MSSVFESPFSPMTFDQRITRDFKMNNRSMKIRRPFVIACTAISLFAVSTVSDAIADDAAMVQPFITETTILIVKVEPKRLSPPNLPDAIKMMFPGGQDGYAAWEKSVNDGLDRLQIVTEGKTTYATVGIPLSRSEWSAFLFINETSPQSQKQLIELLASVHETQSVTRDGMTVVMPGRDTDVEARLDAIVASERNELASAFAVVKDYPIQVLMLPPDYLRRTVVELMPQLPRHLGGGPSNVLTDSLMWASLGLDPITPRAEVVIQSDSEAAAKQLAAHLPKMMTSLYDELPTMKNSIPRDHFVALLPLLQPQVSGDRITVRLDNLQAISEWLQLAASAPATVGEQMRRHKNSDRFKRILLGFHNFHDTYSQFPPHEASGDSRLSWRVHILPFVGQQELYEQFALDEPWDSDHNKRLIAKMPAIYESQWLGIEPGHTTFLAPVGEDTIFGGEKAAKFSNIIDGTSNTAILVEVKPSLSVPWTAPQDYVFDSKAPGDGLRTGTDGRFLEANADGSVNMYRADVGAKMLLLLFQKGDRTPIDVTKFQ